MSTMLHPVSSSREVSTTRASPAPPPWPPTEPAGSSSPTTPKPVPGEGPPAVLALALRSPNPSRDGALLELSLPRATHARLTVHDAAGRRIRTLFDGAAEAGRLPARWDATDDGGRSVASGLYWFRLEAGQRMLTQRLVLVH